MAEDSDRNSTHRQRWARLRVALGAGLTLLQVGVWYPVVEDLPTGEQQTAGRIWLEVDGVVWSVLQDGLDVSEEPADRSSS